MREKPVRKVRGGIRPVPRVVMPIGVLPEAHVSARRAYSRVHNLRLSRGNYGIVRAVIEPHRRAADGFDIFRDKLRLVPAAGGIGPVDASANGSDGGKTAGIVFGDLPHAIAAKRHAGEIETFGITVELFYLCIQRSHGHSHD